MKQAVILVQREADLIAHREDGGVQVKPGDVLVYSHRRDKRDMWLLLRRDGVADPMKVVNEETKLSDTELLTLGKMINAIESVAEL